MTMVRFATLCDQCGQRSEEYTAWPTCVVCGEDICLRCAASNTLTDHDGRYLALCRQCAAEGFSDGVEVTS